MLNFINTGQGIQPIRLSFLFLGMIMAFSCTAPGNQSSETKSKSYTPAEPVHFIKRFKGTIDKYPITLSLTANDTILEGEYYYDRLHLPIQVNGSLKNDTVMLRELNGEYKPIAEFSGLLTPSGSMEGRWINLSNQKELTFSLRENYDGAVRISEARAANRKCFNTDAEQKEAYGTDSLCNEITIDYFKVSSSVAAENINQSILANIMSLTFFESTYSSVDELMATVDSANGGGFTFTITCEPLMNDDNILSYRLAQTSYSLGANHPNLISQSYNVDITTGKPITLADILLPGYEERLNRVTEALFVKRNGSDNWNFESGNFEVKKEFAIQIDGLLFSYDPYEMGSYMMGAPSVMIPFASIDDLISPSGPLGNRKKAAK
jgi:Protein of unknown function (DUF3298)